MTFKLSALPIIFTTLVACAFLPPANAEENPPKPYTLPDEKAIVSAVFENDIFANTDQNYTNGFRLSYLTPEKNAPAFAYWITDNLLPFARDGKKRVALSLGQNMYTPKNLNLNPPDPRDRPYAGWLYGSIGVVSDNGKRLDNVLLTVGMVGPNSYAEQTQKFVHRMVDSDNPRGWDSQIKNEPGIVLSMDRTWRALYEFSPFGAGVDMSPHIGLNLGNVTTDASIGTTFRLGYDLPADYGPPRIRPSLPGSDFFIPTKDIGGYLFAGFEGRAVGRNIFLDGNTFRDSPSVDKKYLVGSLQAGAALTYENTRLSYTHVFMTREFSGQTRPSQFGAVTLSYRF